MDALDDRNDTVPPRGYEDQAPVVSIGDWVLTILILALPLINIIMLFVWAFGGGTNKTKANFAKANLIWMVIAIVLFISMFSTIVGVAALFANEFQ